MAFNNSTFFIKSNLLLRTIILLVSLNNFCVLKAMALNKCQKNYMNKDFSAKSQLTKSLFNLTSTVRNIYRTSQATTPTATSTVAHKPGSNVSPILTDVVRTMAFNNEELLRLTAETYSNPEKITDILEINKELEDLIGVNRLYQDRVAWIKNSPISDSWLGKKLLISFEAELDAETNKAIKKLKKRGWFSDKLEEDIEKKLSKMDWKKKKKERKKLIKSLISIFSEVQYKYETEMREFFSPPYTHDRLEAGLHKLRRGIRRASIITTALNGLITYDSKTENMSKEEEEVWTQYFNSPYNKIISKYRSRYKISQLTMSYLSKHISELGKIKDRLEKLVYLRLQIDKLRLMPGAPEDEVDAVISLLAPDIDIKNLGNDIAKWMKEFDSEQPLNRFVHDLKVSLQNSSKNDLEYDLENNSENNIETDGN